MATRKDPIKRFWTRVKKTPTCWLWTGTLFSNGYGRIWGGPDIGDVGAHVFSYELKYGPAKNQVCHSCDVRRCVRPDHLWDGTQQENLDDMASKGRSTRGEKSGKAKLTTKQALLAKTSTVQARILAERWDVSPGTITAIRLGYSWKWL